MKALSEPLLTENQQRVLDYVRKCSGDISPTIREIQRAVGFKSQNSVIQLLRVLERKGFIRTLPGKARGIAATPLAPEQAAAQSPDARSLFIDVPLFGEARAGNSADDPPQIPATLPVHAPSMRLTERSRPFALRIGGDSMTGVHIQDGDYVVFDSKDQARPGDVVAVNLDGAFAVLRYVVLGIHNCLRAENPKYPARWQLEELTVRGVMVGLIRGANLI